MCESSSISESLPTTELLPTSESILVMTKATCHLLARDAVRCAAGLLPSRGRECIDLSEGIETITRTGQGCCRRAGRRGSTRPRGGSRASSCRRWRSGLGLG